MSLNADCVKQLKAHWEMPVAEPGSKMELVALAKAGGRMEIGTEKPVPAPAPVPAAPLGLVGTLMETAAAAVNAALQKKMLEMRCLTNILQGHDEAVV